VKDLRASAERYRALLGAGPEPGSADFAVGGAVLRLVPSTANGPRAAVLETKSGTIKPGTVSGVSAEKWGLSLVSGG